MKKVYCFADEIIEIETKYDFFHLQAKQYLCDKQPAFFIKVDDHDIKIEQHEEEKIYGKVISEEAYQEFIAVQRKVTDALLSKEIYLMHGALIEKDHKGYFFIAKSGTGKTTHISLWKKVFGKRVSIVNGDKPFLRVINNELYAYGTPWCGKEGYNINKKVKLSSIVEITRGDTNIIKEESLDSFFAILFQQTYKAPSKEGMSQTMNFLTSLKNYTKFYRLSCNMDKEAAIVCYKGMNKTLSFEDILDIDGILTYSTKGISMYPLIVQDKDLSTLKKLEGEPNINDAILYKRDNGQYVLHRLIGKNKKGYIMLGDNLWRKEYGLRRDQLLGVLVSVDKGKGKVVTSDSDEYKKYVDYITRTRGRRIFKKKVQYYLNAIKRRLVKK